MRLLLITVAAALLAGCGSEERGMTGERSPEEGALPTVGITVVDSIGVEIGDSNYVMGAIEGLCFGPDGNIAVLDCARSCVRIYSPAGEYVRQIGARGSGPGELQDIAFLAISEDGNLYLAGEGSEVLGIHHYDYWTGEWLGSMPTGSPPTCLEGSYGSGYVRKDLERDVSGEQLMVEIIVGRYGPGEDDPSMVYYRDRFPFDPADAAEIVQLVWEGYDIASDLEGRVCVAPRSTEEAVVMVYGRDGSLDLTIEIDLEPVPRTAEEMEMERLILRYRASVMGMEHVAIEPDPMKPLIRGLEIGPEGNIWVLRGGPSTPAFDVFDADGKPLYTAVVQGDPPDGSTWRFHLDAHGMLAYAGDPADGYQKVYILEPQPL